MAGVACAALLATACYSDSDYFAEQSAEAICANNRKCGEKFEEYPNNEGECIEIVEYSRQRCADECTYYDDAARRCGRALKQGARWCSMEKQDLRACNEVFQCDDPDLEYQCGLDMPVRDGCSVDPRGTGAPIGWAFVVFGVAALGLGRRRR
jgi:MYXO-CTERM domain-containing protein